MTSVRKNKDVKDEEAAVASSVSNGTSTFDSHPRQPVKNRAVNDKQMHLSKVIFVVYTGSQSDIDIIMLPQFLL